MKVFMIGGTGLLGSQAAKELIARGHEVSSIALPPLPEGALLPPEMKLKFGNYLEMTDEELKEHLAGCEGFVSMICIKNTISIRSIASSDSAENAASGMPSSVVPISLMLPRSGRKRN